MSEKVAVFWFRRDLRLQDNSGLYHALQSKSPVLPIFIFDANILESLKETDARVTFLFDRLQELRKKLQSEHQTSIAIYHGDPVEVFKNIAQKYSIEKVVTNRDYEPYARKRDSTVAGCLKDLNIPFQTCKDQVIFEKNEVVKDDGKPYTVYTPYMRKWKITLDSKKPSMEFPSSEYLDHCLKNTDLPNVSLSDIGFKRSSITVPPYFLNAEFIDDYSETRNIPAIENGTSRLGPHLRFGTVSVRQIFRQGQKSSKDTFINELIWREFFMQILWHFPKTVHNAFKPKYDRIPWRNEEAEFEKWKNGRTGYALVDAGMRELNTTGYMHNRVRMLVASFLCKHLLIDWRWGEAYFAEKLLDYELSSNVGNWQWAAGSGVDAAPYFRIFNPMTQVDKFDKNKEYIKQWIPEWKEDYLPKIVDHKAARERCLSVYKEALQ